MPDRVVHVQATRAELRELIRQLPAALAGKTSDPVLARVAHGFKIRLGAAVLSTIQLAFITKARGGMDAAGLKWKPLSREYLAYQRPMGGRQPPRAGGHSPGGKDGFMSESQLRQWQAIYRQFLAINAARMSAREAREIAARVAWSKMKQQGVRTKLEVFGERAVEIGRDRGILFNSLAAGVVVSYGADAGYLPPPEQVFDAERHGELIVGTNVDYASHFHRLRPLWPEPSAWPQQWWDDWIATAVEGLAQLGETFNGG